MESRRKFLKASAAALTVAATRPIFGVQGANDRIRMAVIGCGNRCGPGVRCVRAAVERAVGGRRRSEQGEARFVDEAGAADVQAGHGRRLPPHPRPEGRGRGADRHAGSLARQQTIDAISAGKDVYVEKPASNNVPRLNAMLDAYRKGKQVVQVGTQQRSWDHFIEAKKFLDSGALGNVTHVYIVQPGAYARPKEAEQPVPAGLDWDMWQGPAPKKAFKPSRLGFRAWYDYGGGLVADWGAHHVDVAHWFMNADGKIPLKTAATGAFLAVPDADPEQVPDTFSISWLYDKFIVTFANGEVPRAQDDLEGWGVFFVSPQRGTLQVNRMGWAVRPPVARTIRKQGPPPPADGWRHDARSRRGSAGAPAVRVARAVRAGLGRRRARRTRRRARRFRFAAGRIQGLPESSRRRRRGLSAGRARPELPRMHEVAQEAERRHGDRLSRGAAMPARARGAAAGQDPRLGCRGAEEQGSLKSSVVASFQFPVERRTSYWELEAANRLLPTGNWRLALFHETRTSCGPARPGVHGQSPFECLQPGRALLRSAVHDPAPLLCGRDGAALATMADRWGWEETSTDWRSAIERTDIDAVDISLPNHLHAPAAIAAAQAGKIILCEKPLALSLDEAMAMVEAARGVPTMVWFNYRRVPAIALARQLIDEGRLGTIFHYDAAYRQQWGADLSRAATWRMDPALAGSGVADDLLTHLIDTALYLNGPIREGIAITRTFAPNRKVDDAFAAMVTFENGSLGMFEATRFGIGIKNGNTFQIHGSKGMLRFNLERLNHLEFVDATRPSTEQGPTRSARHRSEAPGVPELLAAGPHHRLRAHVHRRAGGVPRVPVARRGFSPELRGRLRSPAGTHALQESANSGSGGRSDTCYVRRPTVQRANTCDVQRAVRRATVPDGSAVRDFTACCTRRTVEHVARCTGAHVARRHVARLSTYARSTLST